MRYHLGLLDDAPSQNAALRWVRGVSWKHLPPEVERELGIWFAMPGISIGWHAKNLGAGRIRVQ